jgi:hypothetical protein
MKGGHRRGNEAHRSIGSERRDNMAHTASRRKHTADEERLYVAVELGRTSWKLAFCTRLD